MAYWRVDDDGEEEEPLDDGDWIPLGEAVSEAGVQQAAVTLFEQGVECCWASESNDVADLRRALEPETGGKMLMVRSQDVERAWAAVQSHLKPVVLWQDVATYLAMRPTEDVLRVLDFKKLWPESTWETAREVLKSRGKDYPPDGVSSNTLPLLCFMMGLWLGPLGAAMRVRIDKVKQVASGGMRPYYTDATRKKANAFLFWGLMAWCAFVLVALLIKVMARNS